MTNAFVNVRAQRPPWCRLRALGVSAVPALWMVAVWLAVAWAALGLASAQDVPTPVAAAQEAAPQEEVTPTEDTSCDRLAIAMGTTLRIHVDAAGGALAVSEAALAAVEAVEARLSTWRSSSELARCNEGRIEHWLPLSAATAAELLQAQQIAQDTDGALGIAIGALLQAYDLRGAGRWPSGAELFNAVADVRADGWELRVDGVRRLRRGVRLDAGAFGKGAALRAARDAALAAGARAIWLDFGGQVLLAGGQAESREIALAHPDARNAGVLTMELASGSFATTANSERGRLVDGRRLGHVLDPRTGKPARDFGSLTVWSEDPLQADALSTALFVLGPDRALAWAEHRAGVEAVVIERSAAPFPAGSSAANSLPQLLVRATSGMRARLRVASGAPVHIL
ncbi:MAG: FAD:protein FMN transferase [Planctomycetota bacterium]